MKRSRILLASALLAACAGAPRETPPPAPPTPTQGPLPRTEPVAPQPTRAPSLPSTTPAAQARSAKLDTGLSLVLTTLPRDHDAILQFGILAGEATQAPGLAELTMQALLVSADPSRGRPSLVAAIDKLGGTARVHAGMSTTWIELRVPGEQWRRALQALREALEAPQQSRHQLERMRDELVATTATEVAADPLAAMARRLLLGNTDTAAHCNDLIDRDAGEIGSFQARALQPDRCVLSVEAPETTAGMLAFLQDGNDGFARWKPAAAGPATLTTLERPFAGGVHWAPDGSAGPCRIALITVLPDLVRSDAAAAFLLHACITLDGTGGRFEQLQRERGLADLHWRSEIVHTPDATALVLRAEATPADAATAWRTWNLAQQSLAELPPTTEERGLAARRAPLSARLPLLDAGAHGRTIARLARAGRSLDALDAAFAALDAGGSAALDAAIDHYRSLPCAMVVLGGGPPPDLDDVHTFSPLPLTLAASSPGAGPSTAPAEAANAAPWLERAVEAVGGKERLGRLRGFRSEGKVGNDRAPAMVESVEWNVDGTLVRTRDVLGQKITTTLRGTEWSEQLGARKVTLDPREAELLRAQQRRHPMALLAAHVRGELPFKVVSQRNVGDRDLMVLEAAGERGGRLRLHLDSESCLVRAVEVWETLADGAVVHVHDAWSDYRSTQGLRAPFHRLSTQDDGQNRVETAYSSWTPRLK